MMTAPVIRGNVKLLVSWPNSRNHPWTSFANEATEIADPRTDEALRRFRKFVTAFCSHSKGNLARYKHKIDHERMTKGSGKIVLERLISDQIISLHGQMYYLDPNMLGQMTSASYSEIAARKFKDETIAYIREVIQ